MPTEAMTDFHVFNDPKLQELADLIPSVLASSKRPNTIKAYVYSFKRFAKWAQPFQELSILPASIQAITLYLIHLQTSGATASTYNQFSSAIQWIHKAARLPCPGHSGFLELILGGVKLASAKPVKHKEPITPEVLLKVKNYLLPDKTNVNLAHARCFAFMMIAYAGFLRYDEAARLSRSNFTFYKDHMDIYLEQSKTDQHRTGHIVSIAATGTLLCPMLAILSYFKQANISPEATTYVFRSITRKTKGSYVLHPDNKPLSYTLARENLKSALMAVGEDPRKYGLHSLRAGGCTSAASAGVDSCLSQAHGRWLSESSRNRYIKDTIDHKLLVSKNLGI